MIGLGLSLWKSAGILASRLVEAVVYSNQSVALNTTTIKVSIPGGYDIDIRWGDGTTDNVTADGTLQTLTHDYASNGVYPISFAGDYDQITDFRCDSQSWIQGNISGVSPLTALTIFYGYSTSLAGNISALNVITGLELLRLDSTSVSGDLSGINALTALEQIRLSSTSVTGSIASLASFTSLVEIYLSNTSIIGALSTISGLTSMVNLVLTNSGVSGDIADVSGMASLLNLLLSDTNVDTYTQGSLPAWAGANINLVNLTLDSVEIDDFLNDLDDGNGLNGTLDIDGINAAHSTASDTAIDHLETDGWVINVNDYTLTSNQTGGLNTTNIKVLVPSGKSLTIDWGDGNSDVVVCDGTLKTLTHDYLATNHYGISFIGDNSNVGQLWVPSQSWIEGDLSNLTSLTGMTVLYAYSTSLAGNISNIATMTSMQYLRLDDSSVSGDLSGISGVTSLIQMRLSDTGVTGNISGISGMSNLTHAYLANISISGALSGISGMTSLTNLVINNTGVSGDLADISGLVNLVNALLYNTSIDTYTSTALPAWDGATLNFNNLTLDSVEVDDFLNDFADSGGNGNNGTLTLGGTNAARTSSSDTSVSDLETDGWDVNVNVYVLESNQTGGLNTTEIRLNIPVGKSATIRWGDGATTLATGTGSTIIYTHDYTSTEKWGIDLTGDTTSITQLLAVAQSWIEGDIGNIAVLTGLIALYTYNTSINGNISGISSLTGLRTLHLSGLASITGDLSNLVGMPLTYLNLGSTGVTGSIASLSSMTGMIGLYLYDTAVTGALSNLSGMTSATTVSLYNSSVSGDFADLAPLTSLLATFLYDTNVDTYTQGSLPAWTNNNIRVYNLGWDSTEVDNSLIDLDAAGGTGGTFNVAGTNAARTSASNDAYTSLLGKSWDVTVN